MIIFMFMSQLAFSSLNSTEVDSLVPGLRALAVTGNERVLLIFNSSSGNLEDIKDRLKPLLAHPNSIGCAIYGRLDDLHPENHSES